MTLEKLLWKMPCYRRKKVIGIVDIGDSALRELPIDGQYSAFRKETVMVDVNDRRHYLEQTELLILFNKYQLAERFMKEFPYITDARVIALVGNLYRDYVAGNMWADGMNPDPQATREKLDGRINKWTGLLSEVDSKLADTFHKSVISYGESLRS